jgi:hypothetical protein
MTMIAAGILALSLHLAFRQHSDDGKIGSRKGPNAVLSAPWPLEEDAAQQNGARCA